MQKIKRAFSALSVFSNPEESRIHPWNRKGMKDVILIPEDFASHATESNKKF